MSQSTGSKRPRAGNSISPEKRDSIIQGFSGEKCPHSNEVCHSESKAIQCDLCGTWAHAECEGISSEENMHFFKLYN